jgi:hypothetical protein
MDAEHVRDLPLGQFIDRELHDLALHGRELVQGGAC